MGPVTTDLGLLERMRGGRDARSWQEFFDAYAPMLAAFAKRLGLTDADAADAVQETLVAVCNAFRDMDGPFDRTKGRFKAWLRGIAHNKVRSLQRRAMRGDPRPEALDACEGHAIKDEAEIECVFETEWQRNTLDRALARVRREIDPAVYQAFEFYVLRGEKPEHVARLLGITRNAVYISKTRVLKRVRTVLLELAAEEG